MNVNISTILNFDVDAQEEEGLRPYLICVCFKDRAHLGETTKYFCPWAENLGIPVRLIALLLIFNARRGLKLIQTKVFGFRLLNNHDRVGIC